MGRARRLLTQRVNEDPARTAFVHGQRNLVITWSDVAAHAADWLVQLCTRVEHPSPLVGLVLSEPTSFCGAYLAALANETPVAPLDPNSTADELAERASVLALSDVIGDRLADDRRAALVDAGARVWTLESARLRLVEGGTEWRSPPVPATSSVVLATSGSTGRPKLVGLDEEQLFYVAGQVVAHHGLGRDDRGYCPLPLFHVNGQVVGVLSTLVAGASLIVEERFSRDWFWPVADGWGATWLNLVPAILASLIAEEGLPEGPGRIRFARSASSPLSEGVRDRFEARHGIGVLETYGMTEAASQITANPLAAAERRPGSVGLPVGTSVRVVDPEGNVLGPGATGGVEITGPGVVERYLGIGRTGEVAARGTDGWLSTGDLGHLDEDGFLYLAGRADDVINRGGEKVYPREIEEVLLRHRSVTEAVATGRPHPVLGAEPVAFVVAEIPEADRERLAADLARACEVALSRYKRPAVIHVTDTLPRGATGKVSRRRLTETMTLTGAGR